MKRLTGREDNGQSNTMRNRMTLISHSQHCMRKHKRIHTLTHTKIPEIVAGVCTAVLSVSIQTYFSPPNTSSGAGDKECTHSPLYTKSHLRRGNWKEEKKGGEHGEERRTADDG